MRINYTTTDGKVVSAQIKDILLQEEINPRGLEFALKVYVRELALRATQGEETFKHETDPLKQARYSAEAQTLRRVVESITRIVEECRGN